MRATQSEMKRPALRSKKLKSNVSENVQQYLLSSTLHGLRYIGTVTLSAFERFFFGISFLLVILLSVYFISNIYQKWKTSPVIIGLDPVATNIKDIPFPAITICNMNQVKKSFAKTRKTHRAKLMLASMCARDEDFSNITESADGKWSYAKEFLLNASQPCEQMMLLCKFGMQKFDCYQGFRSVLTDEGLCCTFNAVHPMLLFKGFNANEQVDSNHIGESEYLDYSTWTPEQGYKKSDLAPYPLPVPGAGSGMGLTLLLNADVGNYYCSSTSSSGFKILLHSPIEIPRIASFGFFVTPGRETKVVISPKITGASSLIRKIAIDQRQCIFANEANLSYYKIYSKKNCEMECTSKITEETCGCTLYYMPRKFNNDNIICNRKKASCYEKVLYNIAHSRNEFLSCNYCLPACFEVNYEREISSSKLGTGDFITHEILPFDANYITNNLALIHIFFLDNSYLGYTKTEYIGLSEFISATGGLLGLFMGFSVISLMEIVYFLTLRPYYVRKRNRSQQVEFTTKPHARGNFGAFNNQLVGPLLFNKKTGKWETIPKKTFRQRISMKVENGFQSIRNKIANLWKALVGLFQKEEEEVPPFPYCN